MRESLIPPTPSADTIPTSADNVPTSATGGERQNAQDESINVGCWLMAVIVFGIGAYIFSVIRSGTEQLDTTTMWSRKGDWGANCMMLLLMVCGGISAIAAIRLITKDIVKRCKDRNGSAVLINIDPAVNAGPGV